MRQKDVLMQFTEIKSKYNLIVNFAIKIESIISFEMFCALKEINQVVDLFCFEKRFCIPIKSIQIKVLFFILFHANKLEKLFNFKTALEC